MKYLTEMSSGSSIRTLRPRIARPSQSPVIRASRTRAWLPHAACAAALLLAFTPLRVAGNTITVTISCSANGNITPEGTLTLPSDSNLDVTATPDAGYEIEDWYLNGDHAGWSVPQMHFAFGDEDAEIYVHFQRLTNRVATTVGAHGRLSPGANGETVLVGWGDSAVFTATPDAHYHVEAWSLDLQLAQTSGTSFTIPNVRADHSLEVSFAPDTYTVQASAGTHGSLSPGGAVAVTYGDDQVFTATPDSGFDVGAWWLDGLAVQAGGTSFTLASVATNHTLQVTFTSPLLAIERTTTNSVIVSWPAPADDWELQENPILASAGWTTVGATPLEVSGREQVVISPPVGNRFYRLVKP
jgi:hypothetical protein